MSQGSKVKVYLPVTLPKGDLCVRLIQPHSSSDQGLVNVSLRYEPETEETLGSRTGTVSRTQEGQSLSLYQESSQKRSVFSLRLTEVAKNA
ncbi:hypothetical protein ElyMa_001039300, partial [Elysia marginata]